MVAARDAADLWLPTPEHHAMERPDDASTAGEPRASEAPSWRPVRPGAVGEGAATGAGRGGQVRRVTSLASAGPGSLRAALDAAGPRVIVFEVGGVIDLAGEPLHVREPFVTIAGQTAPPPGITLVRGGLEIRTHDVLVQHLRVRPGDAHMAKDSGWEPDGIAVAGRNQAGHTGPHHVVIDHCSISWAVDENLSASGPRMLGQDATAHAVTFCDCIIAECLYNSTHPKGWHSKGVLIHDHARDIVMVGNLCASNTDRNPVLKAGSGAVVANNLIYNPGKWAIHSYWNPHEFASHPHLMWPCELVAVGNVLWRGPDTPASMPMFHMDEGQAYVHLRDNLESASSHGHSADESAYQPSTVDAPEPTYLDAPPFWARGLNVQAAEQTPARVCRCAGAWPAQRDSIDQRIIDGTRDRTGRIIDSQAQVEGYPDMAATSHTLDVPADPHAVEDADGYTNLEKWLHALAQQVESTPF